MFRIFITNLEKYNKGELIGKWLDLPCNNIDEELSFIGVSDKPDENGNYYEKYFIVDYENDYEYKIDKYDNINNLNEIAEILENLDDYNKEIITALMNYGYSVERALNEKDDIIFYFNCHDMTDVAYQYIERHGLYNAPKSIMRYFDCEAFGRDMGIEGIFIFTDGGNCIEIC